MLLSVCRLALAGSFLVLRAAAGLISPGFADVAVMSPVVTERGIEIAGPFDMAWEENGTIFSMQVQLSGVL
jgi:hypothetical protein